MFEGIARIIIAIGLAYGAHLGFGPGFEVTARIVAIWAVLGFFSALLERRDLRAPWISLLMTGFDCAMVAGALTSQPATHALAYLVLIPAAWGITRHRLHPLLVGIVAASVLAAAPNVITNRLPEISWLAQCAAVFAVAIILGRGGGIVDTEPEFAVETTHPSNSTDHPAPQIEQDETLLTSYLNLRERFRSLRDHYQSLERRAKKDRATVQLIEAARIAPSDSFQTHITQTLRELCGVTGASLYSTAEYGEAMVVRATSGEMPHALATYTVPFSAAWTERSLRTNFDQWLRAVRTEEQATHARSVVLRHQGRIVGVLCLSDGDGERLSRAVTAAEEWSPVVASMLAEHETGLRTRRRLKEAELLYAICSIGTGATTPTSLSARVVRELWGILSADHVGIHFLDEDNEINVATQGARISLTPQLDFGMFGTGLRGWITAGYPETAVFDTTQDERVTRRDALQKRVGSYLMVPIRGENGAAGFLTAATHRVGGLDIAELETLRIVAAEFGQALLRLENQGRAAGLATPQELQLAVAASSGGSLVVLEPLRADATVSEFGEPAMEHALQTFARRVRATLPSGGLLCRRHEGDYVAYLDGRDEEFARSWANEASALASMTGVTTPDGAARIPLAFRAKVSRITGAREPQPAESTPKVVKAVFPRISRSEVA